MSFAGMNYLAIVLAAIAGWLTGAVWYGLLAKHWVAAQGTTMEEFKQKQAAMKGDPKAFLPFVLAFVADLIMAWMLAGVLGHLGAGQVTLRNGVISGAFCWLGFVITVIFTNYSFGKRDVRLIWIDGGHWLIVLALMGAVIGAMGV